MPIPDGTDETDGVKAPEGLPEAIICQACNRPCQYRSSLDDLHQYWCSHCEKNWHARTGYLKEYKEAKKAEKRTNWPNYSFFWRTRLDEATMHNIDKWIGSLSETDTHLLKRLLEDVREDAVWDAHTEPD